MPLCHTQTQERKASWLRKRHVMQALTWRHEDRQSLTAGSLIHLKAYAAIGLA